MQRIDNGCIAGTLLENLRKNGHVSIYFETSKKECYLYYCFSILNQEKLFLEIGHLYLKEDTKNKYGILKEVATTDRKEIIKSLQGFVQELFAGSNAYFESKEKKDYQEDVYHVQILHNILANYFELTNQMLARMVELSTVEVPSKIKRISINPLVVAEDINIRFNYSYMRYKLISSFFAEIKTLRASKKRNMLEEKWKQLGSNTEYTIPKVPLELKYK